MSAALAHIFRHPIKAHGRESISSVLLTAGECLPHDRRWAVAHEAAKLTAGEWARCANFSRAAKAPALMAIEAALDEATGAVTLTHPQRPPLTFRPDEAADLPAFLNWISPLVPADRAAPARIVSADRGMTDSDFPSVSILSLASNQAMSGHLGQQLSLHRWRGNLWIDSTEAFEEFGWIGKRLRLGEAELEVVSKITRCRATTANPDTGEVDADTLGTLSTVYGHQEFGVYAFVRESGRIAVGDKLEVIA